ncbi:hypothetical protein [Dolichospermum phage Dfl-JY45]
MHRSALLSFFWLLTAVVALAASPTFAGAPDTESRLADVYLFYRDADGSEQQVQFAPAFDRDTLAYTGVAPASAVAAIGAAVLGSPAQTVRVNGDAAPGDTIFAYIDSTIAGVPATVVIEVTAGDGVTRTEYTFDLVRPPSPESDLAALTLASGDLSPAFDPEIRHYFSTVPKAVAAIEVIATHSDEEGSITIQGMPVISGLPSEPVALPAVSPAVNTIEVVSTAADGLSSSTYRIEVTRQRGNSARLAALVTTPDVNLPFNPNGGVASTIVANDIESVDVTALAEDPDASITWSGNGVVLQPAPHGAPVPIQLNVGQNDFTWRVVSEDQSTSRIYFVKIYRRQDPAVQLVTVQSDANCCSGYPTTPEQSRFQFFAEGTQRSVTFSAATLDPAATMTFGGKPLAQSWPVTIDLSTPRPPTSPLVVPLVVTSADGESTYEYRVDFIRDPSTMNYLSGLQATVNGEPVAVTPDFHPQRYTYRMQRAVGDAIAFTLDLVDPVGTIEAFGELSGAVPVGVATPPHTVRQGLQTFRFVITAESGATIEYTVEVVGGVSSENRLASLSFSVGTLAPAFSSEVGNYVLSVPAGTDRFWAQGTPVDPTATIALDGVPAGAGGFMDVASFIDGQALDIVVTAASGATRAYAVVVDRPNAPPRITARAISGMLEDSHEVVNIAVGDLESPADALTLQAVSLDQGLIRDEDLAAFLSGTGPSRSLRIQPLADQFGSTEVVLTLHDPEGLATEHRITVHVTSVNDAPSFDLESAEVRIVPGRELTLPGVIRNVSPGPDNELGQQVALRVVTTAVSGSVPQGWSVNAVSAGSGRFDLVLLAPAGEAVSELDVAVTAQDDGGTELGIDTSPPQVLRVRGAASEDVDVQVSIDRTLAAATERAYQVTVGNAGTVYSQDVMVELLGPLELAEVQWRCLTTTVSSTCSIETINERPFARLGLHPGAIAILEVSGRVGAGAFARVEAIARTNGLAPLLNPEDDRAVFEDVIEPDGVFRAGFEP